MVTGEIFELIKSKYGHYASWAIWADAEETPKSNIGDLSVFNLKTKPSLLDELNPNIIFLGLDISRPISRAFGNFHDSNPRSTDYKIRFALNDTPLWGAYMTDIIKDFEEKASVKLMTHLKQFPNFEKENIELLRNEIADLKTQNLTFIAFGKDAYRIAKRNLGDTYPIYQIPHPKTRQASLRLTCHP